MAESIANCENELNLRNDVRNLVDQESYKWIFVGGKGGVGKTTISSSLASILSERRESVLLLSTDPAHSLSDAFNQKFTDRPTLVKGYENLYAMLQCVFSDGFRDKNYNQELDVTKVSDTGFGFSESKMFLQAIPELIQMLPGIDEAFSFSELLHSVQSMKYSVIVFDTAPTGHTLKFLNLPEVLDKLLDSFLKVENLCGVAMKMFSAFSDSIPKEQIFEKLKKFKSNLTLIMNQMKDPDLTTFVCVCIPEFLSVYETERLIQSLAKTDVDCSYIVVNQILSYINLETHVQKTKESLEELSEHNKSVLEPFFELVLEQQNNLNGRLGIQRKYLDDIKQLYEGLFNIVCLKQHKYEVRGSEAIKEFSQDLLKHSPLPEA
ncbi:arsenical pump-driving ATPase [Theileria orientalis strain Shintoku]|uniref:ATPase ASNA1 homolog n=1 Tax=Theileria orientalis strain Shintoku TaxID=869250 RepID=J4CDN4_THEOR|nr:arsenical pump-driving ATPase [Theileria orientalis strain Shintoku]BAM41447.1 arsenical pump-driving ATPase [Theileria orientalis strain Shintoku]|eukprot:XP_009691748.1 arsenical pump-driving ATPase [Theileria orientalis strain Shintoku]